MVSISRLFLHLCKAEASQWHSLSFPLVPGRGHAGDAVLASVSVALLCCARARRTPNVLPASGKTVTSCPGFNSPGREAGWSRSERPAGVTLAPPESLLQGCGWGWQTPQRGLGTPGFPLPGQQGREGRAQWQPRPCPSLWCHPPINGIGNEPSSHVNEDKVTVTCSLHVPASHSVGNLNTAAPSRHRLGLWRKPQVGIARGTDAHRPGGRSPRPRAELGAATRRPPGRRGASLR